MTKLSRHVMDILARFGKIFNNDLVFAMGTYHKIEWILI